MKWLKTILPILFLVITLIHSVNLTFIKAHFDFNRDYIAKNLCINRFNPDSNCKGQCYLMKKLTAEAEKEAESKAVFSPVLSFTFYKNEIEEILFTPSIECSIATYFSGELDFQIKNPELEIDSPPPKSV